MAVYNIKSLFLNGDTVHPFHVGIGGRTMTSSTRRLLFGKTHVSTNLVNIERGGYRGI